MRTSFNVTGSERKRLVQAISKSTDEPSRYLGAPSMAYEVGPFTITRDGTLEYSDSTDSGIVEKLYDDIAAAGFVFEAPELPAAGSEGEPAGFGLSVIFPADTLDDDAMRNLDAILAAKGSLIKKSLGADELRIDRNEKMVSFPWFSERMLTTEEARTYTHFISALCEMARNQKRITAKEKEVDNDKYTFRCFLLRLGFIGAEYKAERKILLKNLTGSSAFKNGGAGHDVSE
jgi:hypothetical protein